MGWGKGCLIGGIVLAVGAGVIWLIKRNAAAAVQAKKGEGEVAVEVAVEVAAEAEVPEVPAVRPVPYVRDEISEAVLDHMTTRLMDEFGSNPRRVMAHIQDFVERMERGEATESEISRFLERQPQKRSFVSPWLLPSESLSDLVGRGYTDGEGELDMELYSGFTIAYEEADAIRLSLSPRERACFNHMYAAVEDFIETTDDETSDAAQGYFSLLMMVRNQAWGLNCCFMHDIDLHLIWRHALERIRQILRFSSYSTDIMSAEEVEFRVRAWVDLIATPPENASSDLLKFKGLPPRRRWQPDPMWTQETRLLTPTEVAEMYHGKKVIYKGGSFSNQEFERGG